MIQIHVARACTPTATTLANLLKEQGVPVGQRDVTAHVCWGFAPPGLAGPVLNGNVNRTKLSELEVLIRAKVRTVPLLIREAAVTAVARGEVVLGRNVSHRGGRDIMRCRTVERVRVAVRRGRAYFTQFVPSRTEFRVWVYRNKHLGTYEKVLTYPKKQYNRRGKLKVGRNYHNGWTFQLVAAERVPREAVTLALRAVEALSLDFGAVDILQGTDNLFYVLETNSAPGVEGPNRQVIQGLARKIGKWHALGYPKRKSERGAERAARAK